MEPAAPSRCAMRRRQRGEQVDRVGERFVEHDEVEGETAGTDPRRRDDAQHAAVGERHRLVAALQPRPPHELGERGRHQPVDGLEPLPQRARPGPAPASRPAAGRPARRRARRHRRGRAADTAARRAPRATPTWRPGGRAGCRPGGPPAGAVTGAPGRARPAAGRARATRPRRGPATDAGVVAQPGQHARRAAGRASAWTCPAACRCAAAPARPARRAHHAATAPATAAPDVAPADHRAERWPDSSRRSDSAADRPGAPA